MFFFYEGQDPIAFLCILEYQNINFQKIWTVLLNIYFMYIYFNFSCQNFFCQNRKLDLKWINWKDHTSNNKILIF